MSRYWLNRLTNHLHKAAARSALLTGLALKLRNQCECVIGYAMGEDAEVTDAGNSEKWLVDMVGGQVTQFLDIGANVGDWTACMIARNANASGLLCEPVDWCFDDLVKRFGENPKLKLLRVAVSDAVGRASFNVVAGNAKTSSLVLNPKRDDRNVIEVDVTTVDTLAETLNFENIDFLKIDCEGYDLPVLKGASRMLGEKRVELIQFEYNSVWPLTGNTLGFALNYLTALGFHVYGLRRKGLWEFDYEKWGEFARFSNFVALHPAGKMADTLHRAGAFR